LVKAQIPQLSQRVISFVVVFVWRQLELAFFGAVTSVAALFNFAIAMKNQSKKRRK